MKKSEFPVSECMQCGRRLHGRRDKKFCTDGCRNTFNNERKERLPGFIQFINKRLLQNRAILTQILQDADAATVGRTELVEKGFSFRHHTHAATTPNGALQFYCYEVGYQVVNAECCVLIRMEEQG